MFLLTVEKNQNIKWEHINFHYTIKPCYRFEKKKTGDQAIDEGHK